ncbi:hypothetical protein ACFWAP_33615 [Streptomyces goshikiensis]|uniref:hypothetical protein n=1 Tax=Streptomyces goshikiensis TaxID=1942 RepID=UPI003659EEED
MDTTTALKRLTNRANNAFDEDKETRARLRSALTIDGAQLDGLMDAVLVTAGKAKPWSDLMKRIERHGVRAGLAKQRQEATEALLMYGFSMSTSLVANAARLAEQEGLRRFLGSTDGFEIDEDEAPAEEAAVPAPQPAPPAEPAPKVTKAQRRTLVAIRDTAVKFQEGSIREGIKVVSSDRDSRPRKDMVEWVISRKWAQRDTSTHLLRGQSITLTDLGRAILAG